MASQYERSNPSNILAQHALVIGAGMAGLVAARVLADRFARVTIIDRDQLSDAPNFRRAVPQARHPHTLLRRGQEILERLFPDLTNELLAQGAIAIDPCTDVAFFAGGAWRTPGRNDDTMSIAASRPLLESTLYRRISAHPRVTILSGHEVEQVTVDEARSRVTGAYVHTRGQSKSMWVEADVVLDTSGRRSLAPQWLTDLGYMPPEESTIDALTGYATRIYRRPHMIDIDWRAMYIRPTPPDDTRGGMIIPMEGDRWHVALIGEDGDYPPIDENGFLNFARNLPTPRLYEAIKDAEPLTQPYGYRITANRMRHYEALPRYLEGFLVLGDAVYALNPVYSQGITAAALSGLALEGCLIAHMSSGISGLSKGFQEHLNDALAEMWKYITRLDGRWHTTQITHQTYDPQSNTLTPVWMR